MSQIELAAIDPNTPAEPTSTSGGGTPPTSQDASWLDRHPKSVYIAKLTSGPLALLVCVRFPPLPEVTEVGMRTLGIFAWTILWWVLEPLPIAVTSFAGMALLVLMGVQTPAVAFAPWANWIIIFLLAACIIGHALKVQGVSERIAYSLVASRFVAGNPWRILLLFGIGAALMSSVMSHIVTTLIFIKLAESLCETFGLRKGNHYAEALFLSIAWGSNLGILTPVGTPPNLIAMELIRKLDYPMGFMEWIMACAPAYLMALVAMFLIIRYVLRPEMPQWEHSSEFLENRLRNLGPMTFGAKVATAIFLTALFVWILPDLVPLLFLGNDAKHPVSIWLRAHLDWSVTAVLVAAVLFIIPVHWKKEENGTKTEPRFVMTWKQAQEGIEWSTLALIAGALSLGNAIADNRVGVGSLLKRVITSLAGAGTSDLMFATVVIAFTIIVGTFLSNIAIITLVGALIVTIAPTATFNPIALLVAAGMAASFDFALPIGTPPSAMVFDTGYVDKKRMLKSGGILALLGIFICSLLGYYIISLMIPWTPK